MVRKGTFLGGCALAAMLMPLDAAMAQEQPAESQKQESSEGDAARASDIIVTGQIAFRNRTTDVNPVLSYDLEYFQRFEPVSVGEMLKRVPGVTFTSDVLEYDAVQFRGLPPGYTQVLINGRRAPGGEADRSFFVDRIPAELVEKIEIVRSPRADQPSEGVAGTLNIVTKEAATFEGGFAKVGALINRDGKVRPSIAGAAAGRIGDSTTFWTALNYQERRNPKEKVSLRFKKLTSEPFDAANPQFKNTELQADTRDGSDLSANAELQTAIGSDGFARVQGFFVDTNRKEDETSLTYKGKTLAFDGIELQHERIKQQTYAINSDARIPLGGVDLGLAAGWSGYREDTTTTVYVGEDASDLSDVSLDETDAINIRDDEYTGTVNLGFGPKATRFKLGVDLFHKERNGLSDGDFLSGEFQIKEDRYDPYARFTFEPMSALTIDAGLRYEITRRKVSGEGEVARYSSESLNPSLHVRYAPTSVDQFRASVARTVRRPSYDAVSPLERDETPGDDDITRGNPSLRNEKAWGVDVGYERRFGSKGIAGVNVFYRDVTDVIERVVLPGNPLGADGQSFAPQNIGDGKTWGVEVDLSAPLTFLGLPDTGIFANYTYLDSEVVDPFTGEKRRFNNQPHHVYNAGFIQTVRSVDGSFGVTVSGRSKALESNFDETIELSYDPDLEAFVEKRIGKRFVLRASVQDILSRTKKEAFRKYGGDSYEDILDNRSNGTLKEYELEREKAGPLYQVTLRAAF